MVFSTACTNCRVCQAKTKKNKQKTGAFVQVIIIIDDNRYLIEAICDDGTGWPHHGKTTEQCLASTACVNFQKHIMLHCVFNTRSVF